MSGGGRRARRLVAACALVVVAVACSSDDDGAVPPPSSGPDSTVDAETITTTSTTTTLPEESLADEIEFIEVSARLGDGDDADVVALAVDRPTLEQIEASDPADAPAWCTGSDASWAELDGPIPEYLVRVETPALDATQGGAERFELETENISVGGGPVPATFELEVDGVVYTVGDGTVDLGEIHTGGTFSGRADNGTLVEGAFLCG